MKTGTRVEVRNRFDGAWSRGFTLEGEGTDDQGRILWRTVKRASDGVVLPEQFHPVDVRRELHGHRSTWWL